MYTSDIDIPSGLNETEPININIYPNPANNIITLEIPVEKFIEHELSFQLTDIQGRLMKSASISESMQQIDISDIADGMYLLKVFYGADLLMVVKQMKN